MKILLATFFVLLLILGCGKDKQPQIPYVYVSLQLYPNSLDYIPYGGSLVKDNVGYRGIIIYHPLPNEFMVYERCCPNDPEATGARVVVDPGNSTCTCPICDSKFILYNGSPYEGPSPYSLMQYRTSYDGEVLMIYN
jgi:nitrite reductase/ring-hydroxylating ferredoxin subunit